MTLFHHTRTEQGSFYTKDEVRSISHRPVIDSASRLHSIRPLCRGGTDRQAELTKFVFHPI